MTNGIRYILAAGVMLVSASFSSGSSADVDRSPKPGGIYRLKPGIFVAQGSSCKDPPNAAIRRYDGKGISTAHSHACVARILSKRPRGYGSVFEVSQSCIDAGAGPGRRIVKRQTVDVPDALHFTVRSRSGTAYRYCPIGELPASLRQATR